MAYPENNDFVKGLSVNCEYWINKLSDNKDYGNVLKLESDERLYNYDLICEGPVEGLVDKYGNVLKYCASWNPKDVENLNLGKGIYYNNVPLIDSKLNKFNFVNSGFEIDYGEEIKNYGFGSYVSTVYKYNQTLYLSEKEIFTSDKSGYYQFLIDEKGNIVDIPLINQKWALVQKDFKTKFPNKNEVLAALENARNSAQEFTHRINNKFADQISVIFGTNTLFNGTSNASACFAIEISEDFTSRRYVCIFSITGYAKSSTSIEIPIDLFLNSVNNNNYYIKIYPLTQKVSPRSGEIFKDFYVSDIIERIVYRGNFSYPNSCLVKTVVSSRHFQSDPDRTFDMKLLKIQVPANYDPEAKEYVGNWNGKYSSFLKWTDNPAWIFYDICTNSRYGLGNGLVTDKDLNKWELYKLSQYCDDLVKVNVPFAEQEDEFTISYSSKNKIYILKNGRSLSDFIQKYQPVKIPENIPSPVNPNFYNSLIFLYDLNNIEGPISKNYKKIIWSVNEVLYSENAITVVTDNSGTHFEIQLINDFGAKWFFENDDFGLSSLFINDNVNTASTDSLQNRIYNSDKNTEWAAKAFILNQILNSDFYNSNNFSYLFNEDIIDSDFFIEKNSFESTFDSTVNGKCLPRRINYRDPLEPRFTCNILIDNETNSLKLLNDICSIFRGLSYYKNNYLTATIDVQKPVSYLFNNSNVKDGIFSYSTGNLEGLYSVIKVSYKDKFENFNDAVEIIEEPELIRNYGIIIKEVLGFGITSRDQARRIGQWILATNRFENDSVNFSTDLQGILLKPGDVIQINDQFKNDSTLQGRVLSVDLNGKFITVDRQLNLNLIGQKIKFLFDKIQKTVSDLDSKTEVTENDLNELENVQVLELKIKNIQNNSNRIYFDEEYNFEFFNRVCSSTVFLIDDIDLNNINNLFKIINISETNNNEYSISALKYDLAKYDLLDINKFEYKKNSESNTIAFSNFDYAEELVFPNSFNDYISIYSVNFSQVGTIDYDYSFVEPSSILMKSSTLDYSYVQINFVNIINDIYNRINSSTYYKNLFSVLSDNGSLLCIMYLKNQSLKFNIKYTDIKNKNIFLGKFGINDTTFDAFSYIKFYLCDKNDKIVNV